MSVANCTRCGRPVSRRPGGASLRPEAREGEVEVACSQCLADEAKQVEVAEAGWTRQLAADIDARGGHREGSTCDGGLEERIRAELELDPLTAATLIVAEEDKRLSE